MRLASLAAGAALALAFLTPAGAQQRDENGLVTISTRVRHPVRVAYRAGIDALFQAGFGIRVMSLDRVLVTAEHGPDGRPASSLVRMLFEPHGDSTQVSVTAIVPDSAGRDICRTEPCMAQVMDIETTVTAKLDSVLARVRQPSPTASDSLARAGAFGYSPQSPIRVGGRLEEGARSQRKYLETLRGPAGQEVTYMRLGSCCEFRTPKGIEGTGLLDAYEVTYPGIAKPITLYMDMYTPAAPGQGPPAGFTRGAAPQ